MYRLRRYLRAFVMALRLTLTGRAIQPVEVRYPDLTKWVQRGQQLVDTTLQIAAAHGMDEAARQRFKLTLDRREISMDVILKAVQHNMGMEYPMLMQSLMGHNLTALYALNLNDQYRVSQLAAAAGLQPEIQTAIEELSAHLQAIPSSSAP